MKVFIKEEMKNILAENMLRFGPRNLTESEKRNLQRLIEQSAAWDSVKELIDSKDGSSYKEVVTDLKSVPFIEPNSKKQLAMTGEKRLPLYIGAQLGMMNIPRGQKGNESAQTIFSYKLLFFLVQNPNITFANMKSSAGISLWLVNYSKFSNGTSQISSSTSVGKSVTLGNLVAISNVNDTTSDITVTINGNDINNLTTGFPSNPIGYAPNLIPNINTELLKYGYPALPSKFSYAATTI